MKRRHSDIRGFTMIEMMVSTVTFLILMGLAFQTLIAANAVRQAAVARVDIYQNARSTLDVMSRELRNATLRDADVQFSEQEIRTRNLGRIQNPRGRLIINDWPPYTSDLEGRDPRVYKGNEIDDDDFPDGRIDEEAFDGVDNDGDGEADSPVSRYLPLDGQPMADGLDNDGNGRVDEGIDEDIYYPRDMINFLSLFDSGTGSDLVEIGYAIDNRTGRDLLRRSAFTDVINLRVNATSQVDGLYPVALQYGLNQQVPDPIVGVIAPWFNPENQFDGLDPDDSGLNLDGPDIDQSQVTQVVEPMALHIVGFDCKAYFHNYLIAEAKNNPTSPVGSQFRDATSYHPYSFPALSWDSSIENTLVGSFGVEVAPNFLPNGADDMAIVPGSEKSREFESQPFAEQRAFEAMAAETDSLPRIVEVTLFVEDENRFREEPVKVSMRVFLPFETGDE